MLLMCKNTPVYNITTDEVLNHALMPGTLAIEPSKENFKIWSQSRYSSISNIASRRLQGSIFGQGNRQFIDRRTRSFSLSDCYWIKQEDDPVRFADCSPYLSPFWKGNALYNGESIPTLYTDGYLSKWWENSEWLIKSTYNPEIGRSAEETAGVEVDCCNLCKVAGVPVCDIVRRDETHIAIRNFTSADIMLEPADTSGRIDTADFTLDDVLEVFGESGAKMITVDSIIGNIDRHAGNFGFLRDSNTGLYLGMAPLFDFDHGLSNDNNSLIQNAAIALKKSNWLNCCVEIAEIVTISEVRNEFKHRADLLLKFLLNH